MTDKNISILTVSETWFSANGTITDLTDGFVHKSKYKFIGVTRASCDRVGTGAGGVGVLVRSEFSMRKLFDETNILLDRSTEIVWVLITLQHNKLLVASVYSPPTSDFDCTRFASQVQQLQNEYKDVPIVVGGDFNVRISNMSTCGLNRTSVDKFVPNPKSREFVALMDVLGLVIVNDVHNKASWTNSTKTGRSIADITTNVCTTQHNHQIVAVVSHRL